MSDLNFNQKKDNLIAELKALSDPEDRFTFIVERAQCQENIPEELKLDSFKVKGCMSQLWIVPSVDQLGICKFQADGDALIPKGITLLILDLFQNEKPKTIIDADLSFLDQLGLKEQLTPNRRNALSKIEDYVKDFARGVIHD
jgi:cysteine desulfuration protein SufE